MKIYIGCDHTGVDLTNKVKEYLKSKGYMVEGSTLENNDFDDYPDFAYDICKKVLSDNALGILLCGTGIGMSIAANKVKGIRCAKVSNKEEAYLARMHNGANVMALSDKMAYEKVIEIIDTFIETEVAREERHLRRIEKINKIENGSYN